MGTTALNGPVLDGLRRSNAGLISEKNGLRAEIRELDADVTTADDLVRALSEDLVGGRLSGRRVLVVSAPDADGATVEQIAQTVTAAGGAVSGRLALQPALLEPASTQLVEDLVAQVVPAGIDLPEGSALARAGAVLSSALLTEGDADDADDVDRDAAQQVVSAFDEAGLAQLSEAGEEAPQVASLVVLVAGPAPEDPDDPAVAASGLEGLLALATEFDARSAGVVVAGPTESADDGGLVRAVRSDADRDADISTVDNADRAVGQVAVVLALREQAAGGTGRYGGAQGASSPVPTEVPAEPSE